MSRSVTLVGLDCGSTTCCVVVAQARITHGGVGRVELTELSEVYRSPLEFTPFVGSQIDQRRLEELLDVWLAEAGVRETDIFGGGALVTGLAAERSNAQAVTQLIESRLADSVIATADAPRLESWLAFMGNCHALSVSKPETCVLNLDIGGGTTNLALGRAGQVLSTGSLYVGARHVEFEPGTYRLRHATELGQSLLKHLQVFRSPGEVLPPAEVDAVVGYYLRLLLAATEGRIDSLDDAIDRRHVQTSLQLDASLDLGNAALTLSGGVGELVYQLRTGGDALPFAVSAITPFGDLGWNLAQSIAANPALAERLTLPPEGLGRATVFGLLRHSTELSGTTLYLPHPQRLPLANVPIVGQLPGNATVDQIRQALDLSSAGPPAVALQVEMISQDLNVVRTFAQRLSEQLATGVLGRRTLVVLVPANLGMILGQYVTRWGTLNVDLIVIDEVPWGDYQFVRLGRPRERVVPLWLYAAR